MPAGTDNPPVSTLGDPSPEWKAVTPHDTNALAAGCRCLYVGVSGDVTVDDNFGNTNILFKAVPVGFMPLMNVLRVKSTGTTATNIVALY